MAKITFNQNVPGVDMTSTRIFDDLLDLDYTIRSSQQLTLVDEGDRINFFGSGFSYELSGTQIIGIPTGTVTRMSITYDGATMLDWTGFRVSANTMFTNIAMGNWTALNGLLFGTGDTIRMTANDDAVRGFGGADTIFGRGGRDALFGDAGHDKLWGDDSTRRQQGAADQLLGGRGDDTLIGGAGIDTLSGGVGEDVFAFVSRGARNRDVITDFNGRQDELHFDNDAFSAFSYTGQLRAKDFVLGRSAQDGADRFIYQKSTGNLWYDADGSRSGNKVLVAELEDGTTLSASDIFIL